MFATMVLAMALVVQAPQPAKDVKIQNFDPANFPVRRKARFRDQGLNRDLVAMQSQLMVDSYINYSNYIEYIPPKLLCVERIYYYQGGFYSTPWVVTNPDWVRWNNSR